MRWWKFLKKEEGKMGKKILILTLVLAMGFLGGKAIFREKGAEVKEGSGKKVVLYKSPQCGCCVGYMAYLRKQGFEVEEVEVEDMNEIKAQYGIRTNMQSCHTMVVDGYFVEGHVPIAAVNKLLEEMPDIDGISLPGMPAGSPGMPGIKSGDFNIFAISSGGVSDYMSI